jgi:hypothetical protein
MRRPVATATQGISLFPFLAVLLCTMGALIVVLVVLNRQSRLQAAAVTSAAAESRRAETEEQQVQARLRRQMAEWRLQHLRESRGKTQTELDHQRLRLSGVEEHRRRLEAQLKQLQLAATELDKLRTDDARGGAANELEQVSAEIESARGELAEAQARAARRAPAYSVVPYDGPNRTSRRPIYIECAADRVIIQPEGIVLSAADFAGPMGPGNPLASAIRAARDHLVANAADAKPPAAEPYPLFLVRPDGIEAYYAARAAMQSWGADFGYQTVDQDWKLEYPALDSQLAELERQAVDEARERLRWLAQMSPDRYGADGERHGAGGSGGKAVYRVSPLGGLVREGGPSLRAGTGRSERRMHAGRGGIGSLSGRLQTDSSLADASKSAEDTKNKRDNFSATAARSKSSATSQQSPGSRAAGGQQPGASDYERRYGDLNDRARSRDSRTARSAMSADIPAHANTEGAQTDGNTESAERPKQKPRSLAETRGANWGLSPAARASNPVTRPIHIVCEGDKLLVHPERPGDSAVVVPLRLQTEDSVDQLVAEVQERIEDWGIAGRGLYWRPQLVLAVGHSGEGRFADLESLLADSGFDVKRR